VDPVVFATLRSCFGSGRYFIGPRVGLRQLEHNISTADLEHAFGNDAPEVIEDYPDDPRGHSCLIRGVDQAGRVLHLVCTVADPSYAITCYEPDPALWYPSFRKRRPRQAP